jgi:hypothetical protein
MIRPDLMDPVIVLTKQEMENVVSTPLEGEWACTTCRSLKADPVDEFVVADGWEVV